MFYQLYMQTICVVKWFNNLKKKKKKDSKYSFKLVKSQIKPLPTSHVRLTWK